MKLRRLGNAGPLVSAIGLGAGGTTTDLGVTSLDTADWMARQLGAA